MKFSEKLLSLIGDRSHAEFARSAGLKPTVINNYINRGSEPRSSAALKIARALGVSLEWLIDDGQGLLVVKVETPAVGALSDQSLMQEVVRRRRMAQVNLLEQIERAEKIDWPGIHARLSKIFPTNTAPSGPRNMYIEAVMRYDVDRPKIPAELRVICELVVGLGNIAKGLIAQQYEPGWWEQWQPEFSGRSAAELSAESLTARYERLLQIPGFAETSKRASQYLEPVERKAMAMLRDPKMKVAAPPDSASIPAPDHLIPTAAIRPLLSSESSPKSKRPTTRKSK